MAKKDTKNIPGAAIGLYICMTVLTALVGLSIVGIVIGGEDGTRPFFIMAAIILLVLILACALAAKWFREKAAEKKPSFASYAFEGEFAPQKKVRENPGKSDRM